MKYKLTTNVACILLFVWQKTEVLLCEFTLARTFLKGRNMYLMEKLGYDLENLCSSLSPAFLY